jgi:hypothetical protein
MLFECLSIMEHQQLLRDMTANVYPNMKKERQKDLHKNIFKTAYPSSFNRKSESLNPEQLSRLLNG